MCADGIKKKEKKKKILLKDWFFFFLLLPGGRGQGDEQSLQNASDINDGALLSDEEVHGWEDEEAVKHQAHYNRNGVKTQLLSHGWGVVHLQDLTSNQKHNPEGEVPVKESHVCDILVITVFLMLLRTRGALTLIHSRRPPR